MPFLINCWQNQLTLGAFYSLFCCRAVAFLCFGVARWTQDLLGQRLLVRVAAAAELRSLSTAHQSYEWINSAQTWILVSEQFSLHAPFFIMLLDRHATLTIIAPYALYFIFEHHVTFIYIIEIFSSIYGIQAFWPFLFVKGNGLAVFQYTLNFIEYFEVVNLDCLLLWLPIGSVLLSSEFARLFKMNIPREANVWLNFFHFLVVVLVSKVLIECVTVSSFAVNFFNVHCFLFFYIYNYF